MNSGKIIFLPFLMVLLFSFPQFVFADSQLETNAREFVTHFYLSSLNRSPEKGAVDSWVNGYFLNSADLNVDFRIVGQEMGRIFFLSEEYRGKNKNDSEFITDCYNAFLYRMPSSAELSGWLGGKWNRSQAVTVFASSEEFSNIIEKLFPNHKGVPVRNFVAIMYVGFFDRLVDKGGLEYWIGLMDSAVDKKVEAKKMALAFLNSQEYLGKKQSTQETVSRLYRSFMGRFPSDGETNYWSGELDLGKRSLDQVVQVFADSEEFKKVLEKYFFQTAPPLDGLTPLVDWYQGQITNNSIVGSTDTNLVSSPIIVQTSQGLAAFWILKSAKYYDNKYVRNIYFSISPNKGNSWSPQKKITDLNNSLNFSVFAEGSNIYLAWQESSSSGYSKIYFSKSTDFGNIWSQPRLLFGVNYVNFLSPAISASNNFISLAWIESTVGDSGTLYYSSSLDSGLTWSSKLSISSNSKYPVVLAIGSKVTAVFKGNDGIYSALSADSGKSWKSQKISEYNAQLNCDNSNPSWPLIEKNSSNALIAVWACGNAIYVRKTSDFGSTWSLPSKLVSAQMMPWRFSLSSNSEGFHLVLGSFLNTDKKFYYYKSSDGISWTGPEEITVNSFVSFPRILAGNGFYIISWDDGKTSGRNEFNYSTKQQKVCSSSINCGQNSWLSNSFCSSNSIFDTFRNFSCNSGFCYFQDKTDVVQNCEAGCFSAKQCACNESYFCFDKRNLVHKLRDCSQPTIACPYGCSNGQCLPECSTECNSNESRCSGNVKQACGDYDADTCLEWPSSTAGLGNETCSLGCSSNQCIDCVNECTVGTTQCNGNYKQVCGNFDSDSCTEWNSGTACQYGCSVGQCNSAPSCTVGWKCKDSSNEGYQNSDCSWSSITFCSNGCSNGSCNSPPSCSDDCGSGETRCVSASEGAFEQSCGNFDSDDCFEWPLNVSGSGNIFCTSGCSSGHCNSPPVACSSNSQCGTDGFTGSKFCQTGNVYQNYTVNTCNNPGTSSSSCSSSTSPRLVQTCTAGCTSGVCNGSGVSVTITQFTDSVENDFIGSLEWAVSGSIKETGVEFSPYNTGSSVSKVVYPRINLSGSYASIIALSSCPVSGVLYFRAYAVGSDNVKKITEWRALSLFEFCTPQSLALKSGASKTIVPGNLGLAGSATCYDNSDVCVQDEIAFSIEEVDWLALGWEGAKFFTIGSCLDDGWFTVWCAFDAGSTVLMIVPVATLETGTVKALNVLAKGSKVVKLAGSMEKLAVTFKKISLVLNGAKKSVEGSKVARAAELALLKIDFTTGKMTSKFQSLTEWFVKSGETAIVRLKGTGATNEMMEIVLKKGKNLDNLYRIAKRGTDYLWLEEGTINWGWKHIVAQSHNVHIKDYFKLTNADEAVKDLIKKGLENGTKVSDTIIDYSVPGYSKKLRIITGSDADKIGSVISAFPN